MVNPLVGNRIYVDASVVIYAVEAPQHFPGLRTALIAPLAKGQLTVITSWITLAEVLIKPLQLGDAILELTYRQLLVPSVHLEILPVDQSVADKAAVLRASLGFKLPDAMHIATGITAGCSHYITGDVEWKRAGIQVIDPSSL